ncbi:unnamed protein product, partial [Adineta ricciae]
NPGNPCFGSDEIRRGIRSDPRPSESNAIPSPGFHRIRRIPVGSDKILYWIRWDPVGSDLKQEPADPRNSTVRALHYGSAGNSLAEFDINKYSSTLSFSITISDLPD